MKLLALSWCESARTMPTSFSRGVSRSPFGQKTSPFMYPLARALTVFPHAPLQQFRGVFPFSDSWLLFRRRNLPLVMQPLAQTGQLPAPPGRYIPMPHIARIDHQVDRRAHMAHFAL